MKCKIIIADDHPIFRAGIREIIQSLPYAELSGEATNGLEAYRMIVSTVPDIAIIDLDMPLLNGLDVCKKVMSEKHFTKFIILTMHKDKHFFDDAMDIGVMGYLLKDNAVSELIKCIDAVSAGKQYASPKIENYLTEHQAKLQLPHDIKELYDSLTSTERIILKLIAQGKTSQEIADNIFISPHTVDNHRASIARKLKLEGKNSILKFVLQYSALI